jgi:WD40 repeat protein
MCVQYSPCNTTFLSASDDGLIKIWDSNTHHCLKSLVNVHNTKHLGQMATYDH